MFQLTSNCGLDTSFTNPLELPDILAPHIASHIERRDVEWKITTPDGAEQWVGLGQNNGYTYDELYNMLADEHVPELAIAYCRTQLEPDTAAQWKPASDQTVSETDRS